MARPRACRRPRAHGSAVARVRSTRPLPNLESAQRREARGLLEQVQSSRRIVGMVQLKEVVAGSWRWQGRLGDCRTKQCRAKSQGIALRDQLVVLGQVGTIPLPIDR